MRGARPSPDSPLIPLKSGELLGKHTSADERHEIARRITLLPLMRRDAPGVLDWPALAGRLAEELAAITQRLAAARGLTDADAERVARANVVLRDYRRASAVQCDDV